MAVHGSPETILFDLSGPYLKNVLKGRAQLLLRVRKRASGHLVTATLVNTQIGDPKSSIEAIIFQTGFRVVPENGLIASYPTVARKSGHYEDEELSFIYRNRKTFGIGHGCGAAWPDRDSDGVPFIEADPCPRRIVQGFTNDVGELEGVRALDIDWLASSADAQEELFHGLEVFVARYEAWVDGQADDSAKFPAVASRIVGRQRSAVDRMRSGIQALRHSRYGVLAFCLAQEAMNRQFAWGRNRKGGPFRLGKGKPGPIENLLRPSSPKDSPRWRPFQLAFQLLVLRSLLEPNSSDRDVVDLLWFPTGGGKTEAYLALSAFEMFHRRLKYRDAGTAVLMRYTLRLLTSQQFERCATLVSVMEVMRRKTPDTLGTNRFRLGLWVGQSLTPNQLDYDTDYTQGAKQLLDSLLQDDVPVNPFLLRSCPRCGTELVPNRRAERSHYGFKADASSFEMYCPDNDCELYEGIPASVVDDDLYLDPPTFLIGTIDKFARMAWVPQARKLVGQGADRLPPSLVIQDEMHLINGPLGSIAGGYEAALDTVMGHAATRPKYIAATATIHRAQEQSRALYARDAFVFPPSGLTADDAFYRRLDSKDPGRLYMGLMGNGLYSSLTSLIQVSAAAAFAPLALDAADSRGRDTYWTQVIYHNSRQELGKTTTMLLDDVLTRLQGLQRHVAEKRDFRTITELSANLKRSEVSEAVERLAVPYGDAEVIDVVACTNMISVGVDIGRLGLMVLKGQPKSTAEYIQASSRIGRETRNRPPGIVLTIYSPLRPRDRSHYESFHSYHQALYRNVEPSSVTPFSPQARGRTLHAALVISLRQIQGWDEHSDAAKFDPSDPRQKEIIEALRERVARACERREERRETLEHLDRLIDEWVAARMEAGQDPLVPDLRFGTGQGERNSVQLLGCFPSTSDSDGKWPTLNSMRHVDAESGFELRTFIKTPRRR